MTIPRAERRASQRRTSSGTAEQTLVGQRAEAAAVPEDNVVEHFDADEITDFTEPPREGEVFGGRRRITRGVVVDKDDGGGLGKYCGDEHLRGCTNAAWIQLVLNGTPSGCPIGVSGAFNGKGYLGLDATGTLGWALPTDSSFSSYSTEFNMAQVTTLGDSTTLNCQQISTDPAPAGGSFASGAPVISSPGYSAGFVLVAD